MKNKALTLTAIIVAACAALSVTGCMTETTARRTASTNSSQNWGVFGEVVIPIKDFESKGLVFTEVHLMTTANGTTNGSMFTYQALLMEAKKVGGDAIVNVIIDRHIETIKQIEIIDYTEKVTETREEIWYGSALAIRYTGAIVQGALKSDTRERNFGSGTSAASESSETVQQAPAGKAPAAKGPVFGQR